MKHRNDGGYSLALVLVVMAVLATIVTVLLTHRHQITLFYQGFAGCTDVLTHGNDQQIRLTELLDRRVLCIMLVFLGMDTAKERSRHFKSPLKSARKYLAHLIMFIV